MNSSHCYLCRDSDSNHLFTKEGYKIAKCNSCGFVYIKNPPSKKELEVFYRDIDYRPSNITVTEKAIRKDAKRGLHILNDLVGSEHQKSLIDIGCGRGYFLDEANNQGWYTFGIDYSNEAIRYAREQLALDVTRADIFKYRSTKQYSVAVLSHIIEHVSDPSNLIKKGCQKRFTYS